MSDHAHCVFCKIADGSGEARRIYEDDHTVAFFPLNPATPGHTLVIPRLHVADFLELDSETGDVLTASTLFVARAVHTALSPEGMNIITSAGTAAQQTIFHLHVHVLPRTTGDRVGDIWPTDNAMSWAETSELQKRVQEAVVSLGGKDAT